MPKPKIPRPLNQFPPLFRELLEQVARTGKHTIKHHSKNEAYTMRMDLYRYFDAVRYHAPDSDLGRTACSVMIKMIGSDMQVILRENYGAMQNLAQSLKVGGQGELDKEAEQMRLHEQAMAELYAELETKGKLPKE